MSNLPSDSPSVHHDWKKKSALFLISQTRSLFGSSVVGYAIIWHITLETSSGLWMMLGTIAFNVPGVIISLWAGVWADRYSRKRLIMLADGSVALATLAAAILFWSGCKSLELLLLASTFRSFGGGVQAPAVNAVYTQIMPPEKLAKVQALNQTAASFLMLASPVVGGVILALAGLEIAFMVDVVTAGLAIIVLSVISIPTAAPGAVESTWREMRVGLGYTFTHKDLRSLLLCSTAFVFLLTPAGALTPLMVARSFGPEVWRLTANELVWFGASIIGGLFTARRGDFTDKPLAIAISLGVFGVCFSLMGLVGDFALYLAFMGLAGFFMPVWLTAETVYIQQIADPKMLGRVFSLRHLLGSSAMPAAIVLFGPLADIVSVESLLMVTGVLMILLGFLYRSVSRR
jgi:DHA3 family macrolide efflux protein-like MFS transporter